MESQLRRALFRFDCPDAQRLGEYSLDLLDASQRVQVAAHTLECIECQADLQLTRSFLKLAAPTQLPRPFGEHVQRVLASLFRPAPGLAYGGLRGDAESSARIFEAGDVTITVGPGQEQGTLIGLVVVDSLPSDTIAERGVQLVSSDGAVVSTTLDDLGNFEFGHLAAGLYALEIDLPESLVVVEGVRVG